MNCPEIKKSAEFRKSHCTQSLVTTDLISVCIVTDGDGAVYMLDGLNECHKGDMFIFSGNVPHGFFSKSDTEFPTVSVLRFNAAEWLPDKYAVSSDDEFCYGVFRDNVPMSYALLNSNMLKRVEGFFTDISQEIQKKSMAWEDALSALLAMLMITLARYINMANTIRPQKTKGHEIVSMAIREIEEHCSDNNMTLESIASRLFISKSHLSRRFRQITGENFSSYVKVLRLNKACNLLKYTGYTNEAIASECGFEDIPTFYRIFKESIGMTPYKYRMLHSSFDKTDKGVKIMNIINEISENLQKGKSKIVKELVENAIAEGVPAAQILNDGLLGGMNVIGTKFKNNEVYVPEVLVAARAMNAGMQILKPLLKDDGVNAKGKVCIGTVQGDLHDIGKNLVKMMMEGKGLEVIDLGTDVTPEAFVDAAINEQCSVICCSALLTTTMDVMADVVKAAKNAGIRDKVKILIGGAPITQEFCDKIGADRYTPDAASAADAAVELCEA